ncbi:MAG: hypothetical protein J7501_17345 [Bdellovibrio sp.]|nr:hypothetical protein [Bdellovibrio sp.]
MIAASPLESARFSIKAAKFHTDSSETAKLDVLEFLRQGYDFGSCRVSTGNVHLLQYLLKQGFFLTDTLVYYKKNVRKQEEVVPQLAVSCLGDEKLIANVVNLAKASFQDYPSHYSMDMRLNQERVAEVYPDWTARCCVDKNVASDVLAIVEDSVPTSFIVLKKHANFADVLLAAVHPANQGRGLLQNLLKSSIRWAIDAGLEEVHYSTQIQNIAAQKALIRQGFEMSHSFYTLHCWRDELRVQ